MQLAALQVARLRKLLNWLLPASWVRPPVPRLPPRRAARAETEIERAAPASSWVDWEVSTRSRRPAESRRPRKPSELRKPSD